MIGLFDSGRDRVYRATVTAVIGPDVDGGAVHTVTPPHDERDLVPGYYKESLFNKAWMKLTKIDVEPKFFGEYSFAAAPELPNYSKTTLNRLKDKVIRSADELRGMDTTIWRVRPRVAGDTDKELILTTPGPADAESSDVIQLPGTSVLHLTDLHFACDSHRRQHVWKLESETDSRRAMVDAIAAAIGDKKIGLVVVTGDLTFKASPDEFTEARTALLRLLGVLGLSTDHLVIVPGNHDIQWTKSHDETYDDHAAVNQAPPTARKNYEDFYRDLFRHEPSKHLAMARRFALPNGMIVEVCALNSSSLETGPKFLAGMGRTDEAAFTDAAHKLSWPSVNSMAFRILALHHHLAVTDDVEPDAGYGTGFGMAVDAVRVQRKAASMGVHLALHGHKHRAFVWRSSIYELPEHAYKKHRLGELSILGGGSAGSSETQSKANYFNLLQLTPTTLSVGIYRAFNGGQGSFDLFQNWSATMRLDGSRGRIVLDDWRLETT